MAEERNVLPVEEVEDTVVAVTFFRAEFINVILQMVRFRTPKFMTFTFQTLDFCGALGECLAVVLC
jgi:hypothetical protein